MVVFKDKTLTTIDVGGESYRKQSARQSDRHESYRKQSAQQSARQSDRNNDRVESQSPEKDYMKYLQRKTGNVPI